MTAASAQILQNAAHPPATRAKMLVNEIVDPREIEIANGVVVQTIVCVNGFDAKHCCCYCCCGCVPWLAGIDRRALKH
ncbi:MAG: hypothetical protein V2I33_16630 [Kangiellaceae bacterium]|nr:hypothetical protein [Kangiellaceae bacterium]